MYSQGEQLVLNCQSDGGPQLEYTWIFSGNEISNSQTLTIDNVTASNGGDYTCNVTNDAGYDIDTVTVYSESITSNCFKVIHLISIFESLNLHTLITDLPASANFVFLLLAFMYICMV